MSRAAVRRAFGSRANGSLERRTLPTASPYNRTQVSQRIRLVIPKQKLSNYFLKTTATVSCFPIRSINWAINIKQNFKSN